MFIQKFKIGDKVIAARALDMEEFDFVQNMLGRTFTVIGARYSNRDNSLGVETIVYKLDDGTWVEWYQDELEAVHEETREYSGY